MAHLWIPQTDAEPAWGVVPLDDGPDAVYLTGRLDHPVTARPFPGAEAYLFRRPDGDGREKWVLFVSAGASVCVNGAPLDLAMRCLRDRDEIRLRSGRIYFAAEGRPSVRQFPGLDRPALCPRCQRPIEPGTPAVKCPNPACGLWYHQDEAAGFPCWTYDRACSMCGRPTTLEGGFRWTPDEL